MNAPKLVRPALHHSRSRVFESERWNGYRPRPDDIIIATYSKCGTTWTQHIVGMLIRQSAEPANVFGLSPWPDARFLMPAGATWAAAEAQTHRRFFKSHMALDELPLYEGVKYVHVARDGRDAAMSLHNHLSNFTEGALANFDQICLNDPKYRAPFPRFHEDARAFFHTWLNDDEYVLTAEQSFFNVERSFWAERKRANILFVHYNDLKIDLAGEVQRIAAFLEIETPAALLRQIVDAASFEAMKLHGETIMPFAQAIWDGGSQRFLHKGTNGRWHDVFAEADLAAYDRRVREEFSPGLARWIERGRRIVGDPRTSAD